MTRNKMPSDWLGCPRKAEGIVDDTFVAFKVPLDERFNMKLRFEDRWTLDMCLREHRNHNIGLWIDLTNTDRYYNPLHLINYNITFCKIPIQGQIEPHPYKADEFNHTVRNYLQQNPGKRVAVHCTHGLNRTGYLICNYLATERNYRISDAIRHFAEMRSPGMTRQEFIDLLLKKFNSPDIIKAPVVDWKDEEKRGRTNNGRSSIDDNWRIRPSF